MDHRQKSLSGSSNPAGQLLNRLRKKPLQNVVISSEARNLSFFSWGQIEERFLAALGTTK